MDVYHYKDCGLDNIWLLNGYREVITPYGKGVSFDDMDGLHKALATKLVSNASILTGKEFRFLRFELDLSQKRLAEFMGTVEETIQNWEQSSEVQEIGDFLIRHIYNQRFLNERAIYAEMVTRLSTRDRHEHAAGKYKLEKTESGWVVTTD